MVAEPALHLVEGGRGDVEDTNVRRELHLVVLADDEEADAAGRQRIVDGARDGVVAALACVAESLAQPVSDGAAALDDEQTAL